MFTLWEGGSKIRKCHLKSKFQNYGRMVVDSLKHPSRRVEKENIQHRIGIVTRKPSNQTFPESNQMYTE